VGTGARRGRARPARPVQHAAQLRDVEARRA
jgi:hypothetical protein